MVVEAPFCVAKAKLVWVSTAASPVMVQIHDLKRRCAEKDQAVRPLEEQVHHLQQDRQRVQLELEEANRDRCLPLPLSPLRIQPSALVLAYYPSQYLFQRSAHRTFASFAVAHCA